MVDLERFVTDAVWLDGERWLGIFDDVFGAAASDGLKADSMRPRYAPPRAPSTTTTRRDTRDRPWLPAESDPCTTGADRVRQLSFGGMAQASQIRASAVIADA
jgi:hypothetical protein